MKKKAQRRLKSLDLSEDYDVIMRQIDELISEAKEIQSMRPSSQKKEKTFLSGLNPLKVMILVSLPVLAALTASKILSKPKN